ncbi:MAG: sugar ABC transporter permease [Oscillospiraceae bacterium]|nr:sugar ABC transporter permease [Oscillospiraceae bacterium]
MKVNLATRKKRLYIPYEKSKSIVGFLLILPWLIGCIWLFIIPFFNTIRYSFNDVKLGLGSLEMNWIGLDNYVESFTGDPKFLSILNDTIYRLWYQVITVIVFSCFFALVMNGEYKGRLLVRGICFLPVIIASGVIIQIFTRSNITNNMLSGSPTSTMFQGVEFGTLLLEMGLPIGFVNILMRIINDLFSLVWRSGVQTLLLLGGLQSVPRTVYEAADVEGATSWEKFWKITFPLISPTFLLCCFYSVIDLSNDSSHLFVQYIQDLTTAMNWSYASTIANYWFLIIIALIILIFLLLRKRVFYMEDMS